MTFHPSDTGKSKDAGSTTGKTPLCPGCNKSIHGFTVTRRGILKDIFRNLEEPTEKSKRFSRRRYHPSCSDKLRRRAVSLLRK